MKNLKFLKSWKSEQNTGISDDAQADDTLDCNV